jgi:hypothetical protein
MNDPSLREGDIVATGKGFVVFVGRDEMHQPQDFHAQGFKAPEFKDRDFEPQDIKPRSVGTPSQRSPRR